MATNYIFLAGFEKSGTSALAGWLTSNRLARYAVPGRKEPNTYLFPDSRPTLCRTARSPWLDASVAYSMSPDSIRRLPEHATKVALCLRNPFERTWSAYRMKKIIALQENEASALATRYNEASGERSDDGKQAHYNATKSIFTRLFPRAASHQIEKHFDAEIDRLRNGTFIERINYEMSFFMSRHCFPFMSIIQGSFCHFGLRPILEKYQPQDIILLSLSKLNNKGNRDEFLNRLLDTPPPETDSIKFGFSSRDLGFDEPAPDFSAPQFDPLRMALNYDQKQCRELLSMHGIATDLLDWDELQRHMT